MGAARQGLYWYSGQRSTFFRFIFRVPLFFRVMASLVKGEAGLRDRAWFCDLVTLGGQLGCGERDGRPLFRERHEERLHAEAR